jgi:hypothetical protein
MFNISWRVCYQKARLELTQMEPLTGLQPKGKLINIRQGWKLMKETNTLAYYDTDFYGNKTFYCIDLHTRV